MSLNMINGKLVVQKIAIIIIMLSTITMRTSAQGENPLDNFIGQWVSSGNAFGQPATSTLHWQPALDDKFIHIDYQIKFSQLANGSSFKGVGYYRQSSDNNFEGFWADNSGDMHPLNAALEDNVLMTTWGVAGKKLGRTQYDLSNTNQMIVTDWIMNKGAWQQFNQNTFTRRENGATTTGENGMEKVTGIGGIFFRAKETAAVSQWYADNLGIDLPPTDYDTLPWQQGAGHTVFTPFDQNTDYFGDANQQWMINFRVKNLDAIVAQLRANGNVVDVDPETYPNGRFARTSDPEGTPIQLWEPSQ